MGQRRRRGRGYRFKSMNHFEQVHPRPYYATTPAITKTKRNKQKKRPKKRKSVMRNCTEQKNTCICSPTRSVGRHHILHRRRSDDHLRIRHRRSLIGLRIRHYIRHHRHRIRHIHRHRIDCDRRRAAAEKSIGAVDDIRRRRFDRRFRCIDRDRRIDRRRCDGRRPSVVPSESRRHLRRR